MKPALLVIAGPNGAGKTTVTTRLREERWSDGAAQWTEARRGELLAASSGIAFETVLSSDGKIGFSRARSRVATSSAYSSMSVGGGPWRRLSTWLRESGDRVRLGADVLEMVFAET